ncbi:MAG: ComF family protein [Candidatus Magasanikbacteria bacterium]|nr:ComF family protein [Candidatus Magasanikbacteria bacterium]
MVGKRARLELIKGWVKDCLFPKFCVGCKAEDLWLCDGCAGKIIKIKNTSSSEGKTVAHIDRVMALFDYGENIVSELIKLFKYNYITELTEVFRKIVNDINIEFDDKNFMIMPVPLHARRQRERGFNQSEILAEIFAEKLHLQVNKDLRRVIFTQQQAALSAEKRLVNLKDAFAFDAVGQAVPERVLLVDDVFTTGATMSECAKALKNKGVKTVYCLALAKG